MKNKNKKIINKRSNKKDFGAIKNKVIFVGVGLLVVAIGVLLILKFSTPEDTWLCTENGWEKHGNPTQEMPTVECEASVKIP